MLSRRVIPIEIILPNRSNKSCASAKEHLGCRYPTEIPLFLSGGLISNK